MATSTATCVYYSRPPPSCRWIAGENEKYDMEYSVKLRDLQIQELEMEVSDMRGKFIIPKLKKVHAFKLMGNEEG